MAKELVPMKTEHLEQVLAIEETSFPTPWSYNAFAYEVESNDLAYYVVVVDEGKVYGYAGMWIILDEGHITTIAVHPEARRLGVGEMLLHNLITEAKNKYCTKMTLEARPSNTPALLLYKKYGFISFGLRPGYYTDTGEDAVIMWKELIPNALKGV